MATAPSFRMSMEPPVGLHLSWTFLSLPQVPAAPTFRDESGAPFTSLPACGGPSSPAAQGASLSLCMHAVAVLLCSPPAVLLLCQPSPTKDRRVAAALPPPFALQVAHMRPRRVT